MRDEGTRRAPGRARTACGAGRYERWYSGAVVSFGDSFRGSGGRRALRGVVRSARKPRCRVQAGESVPGYTSGLCAVSPAPDRSRTRKGRRIVSSAACEPALPMGARPVVARASAAGRPPTARCPRHRPGPSAAAETEMQQDVRSGDHRAGRYGRRGMQHRRQGIRGSREYSVDEERGEPQFVGSWPQCRGAQFAVRVVHRTAARAGGTGGFGEERARRIGCGSGRDTGWVAGFENGTVPDTQREDDGGEYEHENREDAPFPRGMPHVSECYAKRTAVSPPNHVRCAQL